MAIIKIPHFNDNYYEICSALSVIISINNKIRSMTESVVADLMKDEIFDDDPEVNASLYEQVLSYNRENVEKANIYSYILLACSSIEKTCHLLQSDGLPPKRKNEGYGDYFKRVKVPQAMSDTIVGNLNDLFALRHWIAHRNGRTELQDLSKAEKNAIKRANGAISIDNTYIIISHEYIDNIIKTVDLFMKQVAKLKYE